MDHQALDEFELVIKLENPDLMNYVMNKEGEVVPPEVENSSIYKSFCNYVHHDDYKLWREALRKNSGGNQ